jgi:hypothetical protein
MEGLGAKTIEKKREAADLGEGGCAGFVMGWAL